MSNKQLIYGKDAREALVRGIDMVANAVKTTLGPRGRVVVLGRQFGKPIVTKDGVTVAKDIELPDPFENLGAQLCKEAADKTNYAAGDGTTTSTLLAQAIVQEGMKLADEGHNPIMIKRGIELAVEHASEFIFDVTKPVVKQDDIKFVATIAGNDAEIGEIISHAIDKVGKNGNIVLEESSTRDTWVDIVEGFGFDRGYISASFITDAEKRVCELETPLVCVFNEKLDDMQVGVGILEQLAKYKRPFVIIADDFSNDFIRTVILNQQRGGIPKGCLIKAPGLGDKKFDILEDIAIATDSNLISVQSGRSVADFNIESDAGSASKFVIKADSTVFYEGQGSKEDVQKRIKALENQVASCESDYAAEKINERLARLSGCVAQIRIGASTEMELKEKKDRYVDAIAATKAALEMGIVLGGGVTPLWASMHLQHRLETDAWLIPELKHGYQIVIKALEYPIKTILSNAGVYVDSIVGEVKRYIARGEDMGYNANTGCFENFFETGVVDAAKVTLNAIQNAASVACLVLTTECLVNDIPEKEGFKPDMMAY
jgi:chaperonin GroEL